MTLDLSSVISIDFIFYKSFQKANTKIISKKGSLNYAI